MIGSMLVGIAFRFTGLGAGAAGLEEVDIASKRAALSLAMARREIGGLDAAVARNALTQQSLALRQQNIMAATARSQAMVAGAFAIGGGAAIVAAIDGAAQLQNAMVNVQAATGATKREFADFYRLVVATSNITAQSATTIAEELGVAASSGLNRPDRLRWAFPQIAKAADVMMLSPKHLDPVEAVKQLSQLTHLFGAYHGAALHEMIDRSVRLMYTQPENMQRVITQGRKFIGLSLRAGVSMRDIFTMLNTMGQTGFLQGKGGTGLAAYLQYMEGAQSLTAHIAKYRRLAMIDLGLFDAHGRNRFLNAQGNFELMQSIKYLAETSKRFTARGDQARFVADLLTAFERQGGKFISTVTMPAIMAQMAANQLATDRIAKPGQAVERLWDLYANTFLFAWRNFATNFENVGKALFLPTLPMLTKVFNSAATQLAWLTNFLTDHPTLSFAGALGAMSAVTAAAVDATVVFFALRRSILASGEAAGLSGVSGLTGRLGMLAAKAGIAALAIDGIITALGLLNDYAHGSQRKHLIEHYGYGYWTYLKGRHPGTLPYQPVTGDLTPGQFLARHHNRLAEQNLRFIKSAESGPAGTFLGKHWVDQEPLAPLFMNVIKSIDWLKSTPYARGVGSRFDRLAGPYNPEIMKRSAAVSDNTTLRLLHEGFNPVLRSLTGSGGDSVTDTIRRSSDPIVSAIQRQSAETRQQTAAIIDALAKLGVTINIPPSPGDSTGKTLFETLGSHSPVGRGNSFHPRLSHRLGASGVW